MVDTYIAGDSQEDALSRQLKSSWLTFDLGPKSLVSRAGLGFSHCQTLNQTFTQAAPISLPSPFQVLLAFWACTTEQTNETRPVSSKMLKTVDCHLRAVT